MRQLGTQIAACVGPAVRAWAEEYKARGFFVRYEDWGASVWVPVGRNVDAIHLP